MSAAATITEMQELADRYEARFSNLDEICHPSIITDPAFLRLLESAIERGLPLTRAEVEKVFPGVAWEE